MKITVKETSIEADARELRESQTLAQNFASLLSRCFASFDNEYTDDDAEEEGQHDPVD